MNSNNGDMRMFEDEEDYKKHKKDYDVALTQKEYEQLTEISPEERMEKLAQLRAGASAQYGKNYFNKKKTNEENGNE
jgi:hypothetical protein